MDTSGGLDMCLDTNPSISMSPCNLLDGHWARSFLQALTGFVFYPAGCLASLLTRQLGGRTSLVADDPTIKKAVQDYIVPVALWATWHTIYIYIYISSIQAFRNQRSIMCYSKAQSKKGGGSTAHTALHLKTSLCRLKRHHQSL